VKVLIEAETMAKKHGNSILLLFLYSTFQILILNIQLSFRLHFHFPFPCIEIHVQTTFIIDFFIHPPNLLILSIQFVISEWKC
jgi:hypothetical protein